MEKTIDHLVIPEDNVVYHCMGKTDKTHRFWQRNYNAVISSSSSIYFGCSTSICTLIRTMSGANLAIDDTYTVLTFGVL